MKNKEISDKQNKGRQFLSDLKLYTDYLKWREEKGRYETWEEAVDSILDTHLNKYGKVIEDVVNESRLPMYKMEVLASQRNLQYRGEQIHKHNTKMYNCATTYCYSPDVFSKGFYVLLSGTGLGVSMRKKYTNQLPDLHKKQPTESIIYEVNDSIEGWADTIKILISSFAKHPSLEEKYFGKNIVFDYSKIRPKGAFISGGFRAPGPDGLRQSLERIEKLLTLEIGNNDTVKFRGIIAYDIFMHLSDAVLSGGVRRSAMNILIDKDDTDLINAKVGNWRMDYPHRARSNNSVGLIRGEFTKEEFDYFLDMNQGDNDLGFVFADDEDTILNPCFEISMNFYNKISNINNTVIQFCNLNEIPASNIVDENGEFSETKFYNSCRIAAILGTLQAGYTSFPYLGKETEEIVAGESLLGISITGWMARPELFNPEILKHGVKIIKTTNEEVAALIGINPGARLTCVKPSGNSSVIAKTPSGIHPEHSRRYFRVMQLNKESDTAKWLEQNMPVVLEESRWSSTNSDYVVFVPIENHGNVILKDEMMGIKHLEYIKFVQENWVKEGTIVDRGYSKHSMHNVSNTVIIDNREEIIDYIYENRNSFTAVSFLDAHGDKDYTQAPFTSVLNTEELIDLYGDGAIFASGLIVDGLHYFHNDLWKATDYVVNQQLIIEGTRDQVLLRKDWLRRVKKFSKNYFGGDLKTTVYCIKDVHLWHKWQNVNREFKKVDFQKILIKPTYNEISNYASVACSGGSCEITF
jgi:ribonucleoside-triphosphate reductase (thioredoxin)